MSASGTRDHGIANPGYGNIQGGTEAMYENTEHEYKVLARPSRPVNPSSPDTPPPKYESLAQNLALQHIYRKVDAKKLPEKQTAWTTKGKYFAAFLLFGGIAVGFTIGFLVAYYAVPNSASATDKCLQTTTAAPPDPETGVALLDGSPDWETTNCARVVHTGNQTMLDLSIVPRDPQHGGGGGGGGKRGGRRHKRGAPPKEEFCVLMKPPVSGSVPEYDVTAEMFNHDSDEGPDCGYPGIAYNVIDFQNFDFVYFRIHRADPTINATDCVQFGHVKSGALRRTTQAACATSGLSGQTWFFARVRATPGKASLFLNDVIISEIATQFSNQPRFGILNKDKYRGVIYFRNAKLDII